MTSKDRAAWLERRRRGIGSSDIATLCGLSPWGTPLEVYLDKLGMLPSREEEHLSWGLKLEEVIAEAFREATGNPVNPPPVATYQHPHFEFALASPDYLTVTADFPCAAILEIKNISERESEWGEVGTDEVPDYYAVQAQWQMFVCGIPRCYFGVLVRGRAFRWYLVQQSEEIQQALYRIAKAFWHGHVLQRIPPEPDWSHPGTPRLVGLLKRPDPLVTIHGGEEFEEWANIYERLGREIAGQQEYREIAKARMIFEMGTAGRCLLPDGRAVERTVRHRKGYTVDPCEYVEFRIRKGRNHGDADRCCEGLTRDAGADVRGNREGTAEAPDS